MYIVSYKSRYDVRMYLPNASIVHATGCVQNVLHDHERAGDEATRVAKKMHPYVYVRYLQSCIKLREFNTCTMSTGVKAKTEKVCKRDSNSCIRI